MQNPAQSFRPDAGAIPDAPGCYQFRDAADRVVYVGKAKSLRARVTTYFQSPAGLAPRTLAMLQAAASVDWIVVDSEVEALHLEYTLIQRHRPRYNVQYRDDKSYPYLVLSTSSDDVPRARVARGPGKPGDRRFGPYAHAYAIRETLDLLLRVFPVRTCSQGVYDRAARTGRPCLLHHIDRCAAPCTGEVTAEEHRELVDAMADFLGGDTAPVLERLQTAMTEASADLNFEAAARIRDQLQAAERALEQQQVVSDRDEDLDVIALHEDRLEASVQAFFVRHGRLVGRKGWTVDKVEPLSSPELLRRFVLQLYAERPDDVPPEVVVPVLPDDVAVLGELLAGWRRASRAGRRGRPTRRVTFTVPQRGAKRRLLATVEENAREAFQRSRLRRASDFEARSHALRDLQQQLGLAQAPLRIECFDISHLGGTGVVGSMVVFEDGLPRKAEYRRFKLSVDRNDDTAAMREVLRRRFTRMVEARTGSAGERGRFAAVPNLVVIDGGVGQLNAALDGVADLGIDDIPFVGLAKRFEELWQPGRRRPVVLPRGSEALFLLQRVRDEAHRFAITYQRTRRTQKVTSSGLDAIPGIGPARRQALLQRFGSLAAVARADVDELAEVDGVSPRLAALLHAELDTAGDGDPGAVAPRRTDEEQPGG